MLVLPIQQRAGAQAQAGDIEVQNGGKHTSPLTTSTAEGGGSIGSDAMKVTVKNTFIDVVSPEDATPLAMQRGAQTCVARVGAQTPVWFQTSPCIREDGECESADRRVSFGSTVGPLSGSPGSVPEEREVPILKTASLTGSPPSHAPPSYAAPPAIQEEEPTAPPMLAPSVGIGGPCPELLGYDEARVVVKNTFIDIEGDQTPLLDDRSAQTCIARFSDPAGFPDAASPMAGDVMGKAATVPEPGRAMAEAAPVAPGALASNGNPWSVGTELHGQMDEDGLPLCQPCAWVYKDNGCMNGYNCRYCHLCEKGELKVRKKMKIQRLRARDAAAAAVAAAVVVEQPLPEAATTPSGSLKLSALLG